MNDTSLRTNALVLAAKGIAVFPVKAGTKRPLIRWGEGATSDIAAVNHYWTMWPTASIGVACKKSHLVIVDLDGEKAKPAGPS